jgi:hypothetical protein
VQAGSSSGREGEGSVVSDLSEVPLHELQEELTRRQCASDGHQLHTLLNTYSGTPLYNYCECGEVTYEIRKVDRD